MSANRITPWRNEGTLRRLYVEEGKSTYEISDELGCSRPTVSNWLERFGIERRGRQPDPCKLDDPSVLEELYIERGLSLSETADEAGTTVWKVRYWIDEHGIETREGGGSYSADPKLSNEEWLRNAYVDNDRPTTDIADELDCAARTVSYWLEKHGIETRRSVPPAVLNVIDDPMRLRELYEEDGLSSSEIAEKFGCSTHVIGYRLRKFNITNYEMVGADHPRWNGGEYAYGHGWNETKRIAVRERDGNECLLCGMSNADHLGRYGGQLHVHPVRKARECDDPEKRNSPSNLVTLCNPCHQEAEKIAPELPDGIERSTDD